MGEVVQFPGLTTVPIPVDDFLELVREWGMEKCIVVGVDENDEICFGGSFSNIAQINLLLCRAQKIILDEEV